MSVIGPILYTADIRPDTLTTKRILETEEMKVLRIIAGKTLPNRKRNEYIRTICKVESVKE